MNETLQRNINNTVLGAGIAIVLTALSYIVANALGWASLSEINWLEAFAVATSYLCTWLCVHQTRWNYPIGIVTTLAYSIFFWQLGLTALSIFNAYLVVSLAYGYWRWGDDEKTKPVTWTQPIWYLGYVGLAFAIYALLYVIHTILGQEITALDAVVAVLSGVAQFLLDNKKIENWVLWAFINIGSIVLLYQNGAFISMFQYVFFLANTVYGFISWYKTMEVEEDFYVQEMNKLTFPDHPVVPTEIAVFD